MANDDPSLSYLYRLWDAGQRHLAAGRYVAARLALEAAEALAWRKRDARTLARVYLPLLEARRLIRYQAAEGRILIGGAGIRAFLNAPAAERRDGTMGGSEAGTVLIRCTSTEAALGVANQVRHTMRRTGRWLEALLLIDHGHEVRLASAAEPAFAAGLPVTWTTDPHAMIAASITPRLTVPLPPPGDYSTGALHGVARESLVIAWEALALQWQHRHPLHGAAKKRGSWGELAWLRRALHIDPACEPVTMRLIALAEAIERMGAR
jgi:hypothetical protein